MTQRTSAAFRTGVIATMTFEDTVVAYDAMIAVEGGEERSEEPEHVVPQRAAQQLGIPVFLGLRIFWATSWRCCAC